MYGLDDWALLGSTILAVGQYIAILAGLAKGLGKSATLLTAAQATQLERVKAVVNARSRELS